MAAEPRCAASSPQASSECSLSRDCVADKQAAVESGSDCSADTQERSLYCLALVDSETGAAVRPATEEEAEELARQLSACREGQLEHPPFRPAGCSSSPSSPTSKPAVSPTAVAPKPGGPCQHCGVIDSPQWRRGPPNKPVLCNACGTRYRRTNQLGPAQPSAGAVGKAAAMKKRMALVAEKERACKEPRLLACEA